MTSAFGNVEIKTVPRVYGASELGVLAITAPGPAHPRVEHVVGDLFIGLNDADGAMITQARAEASSTPFRDAVRAAVASATGVPEPTEGTIIVSEEVQAAAVLLDPARLAGAALAGDPVVFALARDRLAIIGADDESAATRVLDLAEELFDAGAPLVTSHPIVLIDGAWAPLDWRARFPSLEMRFERVLRLFSVRAYEVQTVALQRPDVHVADPMIKVLETGVTTTFASWPKGTATLLPVVDNIVIADKGADGTQLSVATMTQFLDAAGDAVVRTGLSPARYFVPGDAPRTAP